MQNKLKSATIKTINELNNAEIRTVMATGDNMLTALSVGRKCGIINPDHVVFLGDVIETSQGQILHWKMAKDSDEAAHDNNDLNAIFKNQKDVQNLVPWEKEGLTDFTIAITGKAFNLLLKDESLLAVLQQCLLKGQIFARMSPDDKAKLVERL